MGHRHGGHASRPAEHADVAGHLGDRQPVDPEHHPDRAGRPGDRGRSARRPDRPAAHLPPGHGVDLRGCRAHVRRRPARRVRHRHGGPRDRGSRRGLLPPGVDRRAPGRVPPGRARRVAGPHDGHRHDRDCVRADRDRGDHPDPVVALCVPPDRRRRRDHALPDGQAEVRAGQAAGDALRLRRERAAVHGRSADHRRRHARRLDRADLADRAECRWPWEWPSPRRWCSCRCARRIR